MFWGLGMDDLKYTAPRCCRRDKYQNVAYVPAAVVVGCANSRELVFRRTTSFWLIDSVSGQLLAHKHSAAKLLHVRFVHVQFVCCLRVMCMCVFVCINTCTIAYACGVRCLSACMLPSGHRENDAPYHQGGIHTRRPPTNSPRKSPIWPLICVVG
jgi:hypothetical protein